jgi:hypothetical protein
LYIEACAWVAVSAAKPFRNRRAPITLIRNSGRKPRPDHSDGVRTEASKHLLKPVMGKFSRNIWFGGFRRSDVGIAAG